MITKLAHQLVKLATKKNIIIATAESCTGGMVSTAITSIPGSSLVFDCGFVTYSYESKSKILGVNPNTIKKKGAVSKEVAIELAKGAIKNSIATLSVGITGIAGPTGGTPTKPIGLVYIACVLNNKLTLKRYFFKGNRRQIRSQASMEALKMLLSSC